MQSTGCSRIIPVRDCLLRLLVLAATAAALLVEILSPFHLVGRTALGLAWAALLAAGAAYLVRHPPPRPKLAFRPFETAAAAACAVIVLPVALTAWLSPPNTFDALAYHIPRIVYWAQAGSVAFFPTPYLSQISAPPLAEYLMLHTYVLSGGDHWVNLVSVLAFVGCIAGVSAVAAALELNSRTQALAALVCATLPSAILQASGPKNDCLTALWLVALVYFTLRRNLPYAALALGLALATKGTAYLFAPPLAAAAFWIGWRAKPPARLDAPGGWPARPCASAPGCWPASSSSTRRSTFATCASAARPWAMTRPSPVACSAGATSRPAGSPPSPMRCAISRSNWAPATRAGTAACTTPSSASTARSASTRACPTARGGAPTSRPPTRAMKPTPTIAGTCSSSSWLRSGPPGAPAAAIPAGCSMPRRWPPPSCASAGICAGNPIRRGCFSRSSWPPCRWRPPPRAEPFRYRALAGMSLFFVDAARLPVLENWTRPLRGPHNLFTIPRDAAYFSDMPFPAESEGAYREAADRVARAGCRTVGIDIGENQLEYPFQALLRERDPRVRFQHAGVTGATLRYAPSVSPAPCAVFCLECAGRPGKLALYSALWPPVQLGREVLFLRPDPQH